MKILIVSDLHNHHPWFEWVKKNTLDLTINAGDLLNGFSEAGLPQQLLFTKNWAKNFGKLLAVCSGNHDCNTDPIHDDPSAVALLLPKEKEELKEIVYEKTLGYKKKKHWMDCLENKTTITDMRTKILEVENEKIIITTIPFTFDDQADHWGPTLWAAAARLRNKYKLPWIVVHHEPSYSTNCGGLYGNKTLFYRVCNYKPDFLISGHVHCQPYIGNFADLINNTWCFNPGHPKEDLQEEKRLAEIPNHIILDLEKKTAKWVASLITKVDKIIYCEKEISLI